MAGVGGSGVEGVDDGFGVEEEDAGDVVGGLFAFEFTLHDVVDERAEEGPLAVVAGEVASGVEEGFVGGVLEPCGVELIAGEGGGDGGGRDGVVAAAGAAEGEPCPCAVEEEEAAVVDGADGGFGAGEEVGEMRLFVDESVDEGFGVIVGGIVEIVPCVLDGGGGDGLHEGDDWRGGGCGQGDG